MLDWVFVEVRLFTIRAYLGRDKREMRQISPQRVSMFVIFPPYIFPDFDFIAAITDSNIDRLPMTLTAPAKKHTTGPVGIFSTSFEILQEGRLSPLTGGEI